MKRLERLDATAPDGTVLTLFRHDGAYSDVDNGAGAMTTAGNAQLYRHAGIEMAAAALRPNGRLAYWCARSAA